MRWTRGSVVAALFVGTVAAVSGCVWATVAGGGLISPASTTAQACGLPAQPEPDQIPAGQRLAGPAVTALRGGAASHGFSVDGGLLSIEPPPPSAVPRVSRTVAKCEALAAIGGNGIALDVAAGESGLAIGYAMVTVSPGLPVDSSSWQGYDPGTAVPGPASYQNRLAWVVVVRPEHRRARALQRPCRARPARPARQRGARPVRRVPRTAAGPSDVDHPSRALAGARDRAGPTLIPGN